MKPQPFAKQTDSGIAQALLVKALSRLSGELRQAVLLRDVHQLSYEAISAIVNCPVDIAKSRVNQARIRLHRQLHFASKRTTPTGRMESPDA